jgi:hypothetical protein
MRAFLSPNQFQEHSRVALSRASVTSFEDNRVQATFEKSLHGPQKRQLKRKLLLEQNNAHHSPEAKINFVEDKNGS